MIESFAREWRCFCPDELGHRSPTRPRSPRSAKLASWLTQGLTGTLLRLESASATHTFSLHARPPPPLPLPAPRQLARGDRSPPAHSGDLLTHPTPSHNYELARSRLVLVISGRSRRHRRRFRRRRVLACAHCPRRGCRSPGPPAPQDSQRGGPAGARPELGHVERRRRSRTRRRNGQAGRAVVVRRVRPDGPRTLEPVCVRPEQLFQTVHHAQVCERRAVGSVWSRCGNYRPPERVRAASSPRCRSSLTLHSYRNPGDAISPMPFDFNLGGPQTPRFDGLASASPFYSSNTQAFSASIAPQQQPQQYQQPQQPQQPQQQTLSPASYGGQTSLNAVASTSHVPYAPAQPRSQQPSMSRSLAVSPPSVPATTLAASVASASSALRIPTTAEIESPIYAPYGSSVISINSTPNAAYKLPSLAMNLPPSQPPTVPFNPTAMGLPAPPPQGSSSNFAGLYSSSGFDMLGVLARVAARPNPQIHVRYPLFPPLPSLPR